MNKKFDFGRNGIFCVKVRIPRQKPKCDLSKVRGKEQNSSLITPLICRIFQTSLLIRQEPRSTHLLVNHGHQLSLPNNQFGFHPKLKKWRQQHSNRTLEEATPTEE